MARGWQETQSAKIYQFPLGGRRSAGAEAGTPSKLIADRPLVPVMSSSGWYHEAEMQSPDQGRKN